MKCLHKKKRIDNNKLHKIEDNEQLFATDDGTNKDEVNKFFPKNKIKENGVWIICKLNGIPIVFRVCTGTSKTFITNELAKLLNFKLSHCDYEDIIVPTGIISVNKVVKLKMKFGIDVLEHYLPVVNYKMPYQVLGLDLISKLGLMLDFYEKKIFRKKNREIIEIGSMMELNEFIDKIEKNTQNELKDFQNISVANLSEETVLHDLTPLPKGIIVTNSLSNVPQIRINKIINNMLKEKIIEKGNKEEFLSPLIVKENNDGKLRVFVDYTKLNNHIWSHNNVILASEIQDKEYQQFSGSKYFSTIRISEGHQVIIKEVQRFITTFKFGSEYYQFRKLPFGLERHNSKHPAYLKEVLSTVIYKFCMLNENCIFIYSSELNEHEQHLWKIIKLLNGAGLSVEYGKCEFFRKEIYYKDRVVTDRGLKICPRILENMINLTNPSSKIDIQILLNYLEKEGKFFENYLYMKNELLKCLNQNRIATFSIFSKLRKELLTNSILFHFNPSRKTFLKIFQEFDKATNINMIKVKLEQKDKFAKTFTIGYSQIERDNEFKKLSQQRFQAYYCFRKAIEQFQNYLKGNFFCIVCEQKSLFSNHCNHFYRKGTTERYKRWNDFFSSYRFKFIVDSEQREDLKGY
ncbi:hypothetical protein SNEBB_009295 [Seison nebaliae]|nr:hypothetical protein SNEBB_009295 [Seison nebaliae]